MHNERKFGIDANDIVCIKCSIPPRGVGGSSPTRARPNGVLNFYLHVDTVMQTMHCAECDTHICIVCYSSLACNIVPSFGRACGACSAALQAALETHPSIHSRVLKDKAYAKVMRKASELANNDPSIS